MGVLPRSDASSWSNQCAFNKDSGHSSQVDKKQSRYPNTMSAESHNVCMHVTALIQHCRTLAALHCTALRIERGAVARERRFVRAWSRVTRCSITASDHPSEIWNTAASSAETDRIPYFTKLHPINRQTFNWPVYNMITLSFFKIDSIQFLFIKVVFNFVTRYKNCLLNVLWLLNRLLYRLF